MLVPDHQGHDSSPKRSPADPSRPSHDTDTAPATPSGDFRVFIANLSETCRKSYNAVGNSYIRDCRN
jgi:hypothetical protein